MVCFAAMSELVWKRGRSPSRALLLPLMPLCILHRAPKESLFFFQKKERGSDLESLYLCTFALSLPAALHVCWGIFCHVFPITKKAIVIN